jgi:hypothetical protein
MLMEIQALRLLLTEHDLQRLAVEGAGADGVIRGVQVRIAPEGVYVSGVYPTSFLDVPFVTHWQLSVRGGVLAARLAGIQTGNGDGGLDVFGLLGPGAVRGTIMNVVARAVQGDDSFRVHGETVFVDPDRLAARRGWPLRANLSTICCHVGGLVIESAGGGGS